eukprot:TRINITY_DN22001_c0_g1_i1.p1 TRINITY_DN22001_c0_g1~~TRINITY_DN22001_c0_g1_i1.p1  ORF type:complete len:309 (-),score=42.94 TRINITY_DN22001_c0_g1_i1:223-1095(-)
MAGICRVGLAARSLERLCLAPSRSFGAAALQMQYDEDDDDYELCSDRLGLAPKAESEVSIDGRGVQWAFIGDPGAQKHVYAARISKLLEVPYISMGDLVRQELHPRSSLYKQIANALNEGKLVPEDIIFALLSKRLEDGYCRGETGFILDGIPRTRIQAEILDQIADIDLVVNFKCMKECLVKKHLGSGTCSHCGKSFNTSNSEYTSLDPSLTAHSHHALLRSSTDGTAQKEKLRIYAEQSKPLEDYYKEQKKLLDFHVAGGPGETWQGLLAALHLQHMDVLHSSQKLTA